MRVVGFFENSTWGAAHVWSRHQLTRVQHFSHFFLTNNIFSISFRIMSKIITCAKRIIFPANQDSFDRQSTSSPKPAKDYYDSWEPNTDEKELIKLTWSNDFDTLFVLGSSIYIYIFEHNPKTKKLFPGIHQHGENWQESKEFRKQALNFVQVYD
jgi:hypothetical protein